MAENRRARIKANALMMVSRHRPENVGIPLTKVSRGTRFNAMDTGYLTGLELGDKRRTPLMASCVAGNLGDVKALLENAGAGSINKQDTSGKTALLHTIMSERPALNELTEGKPYRLLIVEALIRGRPGAVAQVADVNLGDRENYTPLMAASLRGYTDIVRVLLTAGANVNLRDNENDSALTCASYGGNTDIIRLFLERGCDIESADNIGRTCLILASMMGKTDNVRFLLESGANIAAEDTSDRSTALCYAADHGHLDTVQALVTAGANVDAGNNSPLIYASGKGYTEIVQALLSAGANVEKISQRGESPLLLATRYNHLDTVRALLTAGTNVDALYNNTWHDTPLIYASKEGRTDIVRELIAAGANVNLQNDRRDTALTVASQRGNAEIITALLAAGADVNMVNQDNNTALYLACEFCQLECVRILLDNGADMEIAADEDSDNFTPLAIAIANNHSDVDENQRLEIIRLLVSRGANINAVLHPAAENNYGNPVPEVTPLSLAREKGDPNILEALGVAPGGGYIRRKKATRHKRKHRRTRKLRKGFF